MLHFERFLSDENVEISDDIEQYIIDFTKHKSENPMIDKKSVLQLIGKYEEYKKQTLLGRHGKTPQYYAIYTQ